VTEIRIRVRRPADVDKSVRALALVHQGGTYPTNWPADPAGWLTPTDMIRSWVGVDPQDTVVGHLLLRGGPAGEVGVAHVSRLFVTPDARGAGLGAALLDEARQWATARGLSLALEVVVEEGSSAVALYERTGWRRVRTAAADFAKPDGGVVMVHHYVLAESTG
jgi:GNAT superfamily N-acetyltransferase